MLGAADSRSLTPFIVAAAVWMAAGEAQQTFRSRVDLMQRDVSVTDRDGRPVRNLTADDFEILEDGANRPIAAFAAIELGGPTARTAAAAFPLVPADVQHNRIEDRRLIVLYLDAFTLDLASLRSAKQIGHAIVDRLGPSDLAAVVLSGLDDQAQDFTADRARLHAAVDRLIWSSGQLLIGLRLVVDQLASVTDRRKVVFLVTRGVRFNPDDLMPMLVTFGRAGAAGQMSETQYRMQGIFLAAERANVNIYAVDPTGLGTSEPGRGGDDGRSYRDFPQIVSHETRGRAIINTNEPERQVARLLAENDAYYLIGFQPTQPMDGRFRRLTLRVRRPEVQVRARSGYFAIAEPPAEPATAAARISGLLPRSDLPMRVSAIPFAAAGPTPAVLFIVGVDLPAAAGPRSEVIDVEMRALDGDGRVRGSVRREARLTVRPNAPATLQFLSTTGIRPGRYQVRVAARASELGTDGSVWSDVEVPDFARSRVSMSGVMLGGPQPDVPTVPRDALTDLTSSLVPTLRREFGAADRIAASVRIYKGGNGALTGVRVAARLIRADGATVAESSEVLDPSRFATARSAEYQYALPLSGLATGPYRLTLEAQIDRTTIQRHVLFTVQ